MAAESRKIRQDETLSDDLNADAWKDAMVDLAGLLPIVLLSSCCVFCIATMIAALILFFIFAALGLDAIGIVFIPICGLLGIASWLRFAYYCVQKASGC